MVSTAVDERLNRLCFGDLFWRGKKANDLRLVNTTYREIATQCFIMRVTVKVLESCVGEICRADRFPFTSFCTFTLLVYFATCRHREIEIRAPGKNLCRAHEVVARQHKNEMVFARKLEESRNGICTAKHHRQLFSL